MSDKNTQETTQDSATPVRLQLHPAWRQAVEDAHTTFTWGDVIPHEWLRDHFQLEEPKTVEDYKRHQFDLLRCVDSFRDYLLTKYKMDTRSVRGVGYEVIHPRAQADNAMEELGRKIGRAMDDTRRSLLYVENRLLNIEQAQHHAEQQAKFAHISAMNKRALERGDSGQAPQRLANGGEA